MVKAQRQAKDLAARKRLIFDIQRYAAEQQYDIRLASRIITSSWQPNMTFDYGNRAAALWLERWRRVEVGGRQHLRSSP
jgi:hypothetical protein